MTTRTLPAQLLSGMRREATIGQLLMDPLAGAAGDRALMCWLLPPWQRPEVWEPDRKARYIESVFLGLGTGYYVVNQPDWDHNGLRPMAGWLLDGQQRIAAIRDFLRGELPIFDGLRFADLSLADQRKRFLNVPFPYVEIKYTDDESLLLGVYERLNFGGVPHSQADRELVSAAARPRERP